MIAALLLAACIAPAGQPTPTLGWDAVLDAPGAIIAGYRIFYRYPGGVFQTLADAPCQYAEAGERTCPGAEGPFRPLQRWTGVQLDTLEFAVKAYDADGDFSPNYSNVVSVCMPEQWAPGKAYR